MKRYLLIVLGLVAAVAVASNIKKKSANAGTTTVMYCAPATGRTLSVQCLYNVYLTTGKSLSDGGTSRTSDGGAPIVADTGDELVAFPGDPYIVTLGNAEHCVAVIGTDGGADTCLFFDRNAP